MLVGSDRSDEALPLLAHVPKAVSLAKLVSSGLEQVVSQIFDIRSPHFFGFNAVVEDALGSIIVSVGVS